MDQAVLEKQYEYKVLSMPEIRNLISIVRFRWV